MTKKKYDNLTKSEALALSWKHRKDYKGYDKTKGSKYNSWRSIVNTKRGISIGFPEEWKLFENFDKDTDGWKRGMVLCRKDSTKPYSKENCEWREKGQENLGKLIQLTYKGETKTILEWCEQFNLNYNGVRQRYFKGKDYTAEQILFGKEKKLAGVVADINEISEEQKKKDKVSKMLSQYRLKDKKKGLVCDIDNKWLYDTISNGKCFYCGDTKRLGLDRIDNTKGHTKDNVVVCCYECNVARADNFTHEEMLILGNAIRTIKNKRNENK